MNWASIIGSVLALAGVVYVARKTSKSSDRALAASSRTRQEEIAQSINSAESSGFTRAKEMIESAAEAQRVSFESTVKSMREQMTTMQGQIDRQGTKLTEQAREIETQRRQIDELQDGRMADRRTYSRYIQKLLDLLEQNNIVYPVPPDFFENNN